MATFLEMQQELADRLNLDQTVTANGTKLKRWLNLIQQDITARFPFEFLFGRTYIQTQQDKTAGTIQINSGSTSATGSGTSFVADDKRSFIQFEGDNNWYQITAVSGQNLTVNPAAASNFNGTYVLRKFYYDLPSDLFSIYDIKQTVTPLKLVRLGIFTMDTYQPNVQTVGVPTSYYLFRLNIDTAATGAKNYQIGFFPTPDAAYNLNVNYMIILNNLTADADISLLPVPYHTIMIDGAEWLGSKFLNSDKEPVLKQAYEYGLGKLIEKEDALGDWMPVLASSDVQLNSRFLPFPTTYEQPR